MNRQERAKQFMPFDALKGLQEELRKKEIEYEEKKEMCDTSLEELENEFNKLEVGNTVEHLNPGRSVLTRLYTSCPAF